MASEIIEYDGPIPDEQIKKVPWKEILSHHRKQYVFRSKVGDIILKRIGQLDVEAIVVDMLNSDPTFFDSLKRQQMLWAKAELKDGLTDDEMRELEEIGLRFLPYMKSLTFGCFVDPPIRTIDDFDALITALPHDEQSKLYKLLAELSTQKVDGEVLGALPTLTREFGVKLPDDLNVENITATQSGALMDHLRRENELIRGALKK